MQVLITQVGSLVSVQKAGVLRVWAAAWGRGRITRDVVVVAAGHTFTLILQRTRHVQRLGQAVTKVKLFIMEHALGER